MQACCIIGVDVFVFITGWFSTRLHPKSIARLLFICAFFAAIEMGYQLYVGSFSLASLDFLSSQS